MKVNQYELSLMVEAIQSNLIKEKRPRGECDKMFILPIENNIPKDFKTI